MNIVELNNVSKSFSFKGKEIEALKDVSLSVREGEIFSLLGPNGAGKTTLLSIIIGMLTQDSGTVKILGKDTSKDKSFLEKISFLSAGSRFHWVLGPIEILSFYGMSYGIDSQELKKRIDRLMDFFGLENTQGRKFYTLSTGEKMRLALAKSLINYPRLIIMDEPTMGLDPDIAVKVRDEIRRISRKFKTTIILTSHYMQEVEQLSDRIAFISHGSVLDIGTLKQVKSRSFGHMEVSVKADSLPKSLRSLGFKIKGKTITKKLGTDESISELLSLLSAHRVKIKSIEIKEPSLEDYFIKMVKRNEAQ